MFELRDGKMVLTELAPGLDLERDVLANIDFKPEIAAELKTMDPAIFRETWGGLDQTILLEREK